MPLIDDSPFPEGGDYRSIDHQHQPAATMSNDEGSPLKRSRLFQKALALWFAGTLITGTTLYTAITSGGWTGNREIRELSPNEWENAFEQFYIKFNKEQDYQQDSLEYKNRFQIYKNNLKEIQAYNEQAEDGVTLGENQFSDLTFTEFKRRHLTNFIDLDKWDSSIPLLDHTHFSFGVKREYPLSHDWNTRGCVTPVKNQAKCGSCWAFSTTGAVEGAICAQLGGQEKLVSLSEQELVDCAFEVGERGCNGGFMDKAIEYVAQHGGLCTEASYPYRAAEDSCQRDQCGERAGAQISGFYKVTAHSEEDLVRALNEYGPVAAGIEADRAVFQHYESGVLDLPCGHHLNHAVLVVGYNETAWTIKNSWGTTWGNNGFIYLARNAKRHHHQNVGQCGLLLSPLAALVKRDPTTDLH